MQIAGHQEEAEQRSEMAGEWRALGNVIDRLTFVVSVIILLSLFIWMMMRSSQSQLHEEHTPEEEEVVSAADHH